MLRPDGRRADEMRPVTIERGYVKHAEGSVMISVGDTRVICTASIEEKVPQWLRGSGQGWVTAEYGMIPRSTHERTPREASKGKVGGRTHEIQRLIGRALRAVVDLEALGERTIWLDCDVIQADGGTRTAAITGAFVALVDSLAYMQTELAHELPRPGEPLLPVSDFVAAVSVGIVDGQPVLDLDFKEDAAAEVDMNVVMTGGGGMIEVQGTAEGALFDRRTLNRLLDLAEEGIGRLVEAQREALGPYLAARIGKK